MALISPPLFALLSDFGHADAYVAAMQGVILQLLPDARFVHISHDISPGDVEHGAELLADMQSYLPRNCISLAVVDPGVGSARAALAIRRQDGRLFVGPDNGLLMPAMLGQSFVAHRIENREFLADKISATFHGRDVFAHAAAHLGAALSLQKLGAEIKNVVALDLPRARREEGAAHGQILRQDRFGNLISSICSEDIPAEIDPQNVRVEAFGQQIQGIVKTYAQVEAAALLATWGGFGRLELAINGGSAAQALNYEKDHSEALSVHWK